MGKRGPQPENPEALRLRGSTKLRKQKAFSPTAKPKRSAPRRRPLGNLAELIRLIPGYDPHRDAKGFTFNDELATKAIQFIESLTHVKGEKARTPFLLEDWQKAIVANLFGWVSPAGTRRFKECFLFVPRKNGKTPLAAAIILYLLFEDGEHGAEVYGAASEFHQATLVFQHAAGMIRQNAALFDRCKIYAGQAKAIQLKQDYSTYKVVSREASSQHGFNSSAYVIDEVHALPDSELLDVLATSTGARRQPLALLISTSDFEREGSPCNAKHDYASKVRDGVIVDPRFLPVIYEASPEDDWTTESTWRKANPNYGVSVSAEYLAEACKKAQETPRFENTFKRLHLNIRTQNNTLWLPLDKWDLCRGPDILESELEGRECWAGLDLASTRDLTAFVMAFPNDDDSITLIPRFWIPGDTAADRERKDRIPYTDWIRQGWITPTPGNVCDYAKVRADIVALSHRFNLVEIALDRLFQGDALGQQLSGEDGLNVIAHGQGFLSMAAPTKKFEELVIGAKLRHGGNPVLRWHASNVSVELDAAGNIKPSRKKSTEKIDGIVAAIMAVGRLAGRERNAAPEIFFL